MQTILVLAHDDCGQEARLETAIDLSRALGAHLTCLDVAAVPELIVTAGGGPDMPLLLSEEIAIERHNRAAVCPRIAAAGIDFDWIDVTGKLASMMTEGGRLADLVIINRILDDSEYPDMFGLARHLVGALHAPILAVPQRGDGFAAHGSAIVLWDGSPDAEAALSAAIPLLKLAGIVTILQVDDSTIGLPTRHASNYLLRHGIVSHSSHHERFGGSVGRAIERYFHRHEPAYAVMGAFGQRRWHDALFGSTTGHLLATSPVPLLLARRVK